MSKFFKKTFIKIKPEVAPGICPHCEEMSTFVSIVNDSYRCMTCGIDVQQKINGVISYIPSGPSGSKIKLERVPQKTQWSLWLQTHKKDPQKTAGASK